MVQSEPNEKVQHPIAHIALDKRYEWMRTDCSELHSAREAREDGLVRTITQISSAALLAIPSLIYSTKNEFPSLIEVPILYISFGLLILALTSSMLEQYLSGIAYRRQIEIVQSYYLLYSEECDDPDFVRWVRITRNAACIVFGMAIVTMMIALFNLHGVRNVEPEVATATTATATTDSPPSAETGSRRRSEEMVGSKNNSTTP